MTEFARPAVLPTLKAPAKPAAPKPAAAAPPVPNFQPAPLKVRVINLIAVLLPFAGFVAAIVLLWGVAFNWVYLALFLSMYVLTGLGITVGFHRLFTHRSFRAPKWVEYLWGILGSMAVQGPVLEWVATHRQHHQHSDHDHDPHSPHHHGDTVMGVLRGLWHAHAGWFFVKREPDFDRYVKDLKKDPVAVNTSKLFPLWVVLGLLIPAVIGGLVTMSWLGVLLGFIWGGLARVFFVHHVTWSVNSVCHLWGKQHFASHDESRNNLIVGVLAFGEGWHNNHHAFPTSARHGLKWWQFDSSYLVIRAMAALGLARDIRLPKPERLEAKAIPPKRR